MDNYLPLKKYIRTNPSDSKSSLRLCSIEEPKGHSQSSGSIANSKYKGT